MPSYKNDPGEEALQPFKDQSGFYTSAKRSKIMSRIKGKNTKPEILLRRALWKKGYRYRIHAKHLPGKPDISFKKYRLAIFIDGEFWHGYDWENRKHKIKRNREYWLPKIAQNIARDKKYTQQLEAAGWTVLRFWSKEIEKSLEYCLETIITHLGYYEQLQ